MSQGLELRWSVMQRGTQNSRTMDGPCCVGDSPCHFADYLVCVSACCQRSQGDDACRLARIWPSEMNKITSCRASHRLFVTPLPRRVGDCGIHLLRDTSATNVGPAEHCLAIYVHGPRDGIPIAPRGFLRVSFRNLYKADADMQAWAKSHGDTLSDMLTRFCFSLP